jgi:hypothetical protein
VSEIEKLIAHHRFLWADQIYQSAVAATDEECDALMGMHDDEIREIEDKLVELIPEDFDSTTFWNSQPRWLMRAACATRGKLPCSRM